MNSRFWLSTIFLRIALIEALNQGCRVQYSISGMFLKGHTFKTVQRRFPGECFIICDKEARCQSFNVIIGRNICELNSRTKEARPKDFLPDPQRFYMKRTVNRVPLGSIQELPAESCAEIKASEGRKMADSRHWIYADENADQVIQATCQDGWQKINKGLVCFGSKDDTYGAFTVTKTGLVKAMKLVHRNGSIKCNSYDTGAYWSCSNLKFYAKNTFMTIITNASREALLPPREYLKALTSRHQCIEGHSYELKGIDQNSTELVFGNLPSPLPLSKNQQLQIWYGQDWKDCGESDNSGATCVDVYAWYM